MSQLMFAVLIMLRSVSECSGVELLHEVLISKYTPIRHIAISEDGEKGIASDDTGALIRFDRHGITNLTTKYDLVSHVAAISPDGSMIAVQQKDSICILKFDSLVQIASFHTDTLFHSLVWLAGGKFLVGTTDDEQPFLVLVYSQSKLSADPIKYPKLSRIRPVIVPAKPEFLVRTQSNKILHVRLGSKEATYELIDTRRQSIEHCTTTFCYHFHLALIHDHDGVYSLNLREPHTLTKLPIKLPAISSPIGIGTNAIGIKDRTIVFVNITTGRESHSIKFKSDITSLCSSLDGRTLAIGSDLGRLHIFRLRYSFPLEKRN